MLTYQPFAEIRFVAEFEKAKADLKDESYFKSYLALGTGVFQIRSIQL